MNSSQSLAQKILQIIEAEKTSSDLSGIQASLDAINARLDLLEAATPIPQPATLSSLLTHPSQDRFAIAEAIADEIFAGDNKEKACAFEPNGKPCDHCSMCSSRGF